MSNRQPTPEEIEYFRQSRKRFEQQRKKSDNEFKPRLLATGLVLVSAAIVVWFMMDMDAGKSCCNQWCKNRPTEVIAKTYGKPGTQVGIRGVNAKVYRYHVCGKCGYVPPERMRRAGSGGDVYGHYTPTTLWGVLFGMLAIFGFMFVLFGVPGKWLNVKIGPTGNSIKK